MGTNDRKKFKTAANLPKRQQHITCSLSDEEMQIVERYLNKYKIENKSRWLRETVLQFVYKNMQEDYPTLFGEHDMRR